jgi:type 1 glutamine amidotransferase
MKKLAISIFLLLSLTACLHDDNDGSGSGNNAAANNELRSGPFKMLLFSKTAGFRHASIEVGVQTIQQLAADNDFSVDHTEDASQFNVDNLAQYEVVGFLNTTLDVLNAEQEAAFEEYVHSGGAYIGIHSAADTEHDWPFYGEVVGAQFLAHPVLNQPGTLRIEDPGHPSVAHVGNPWQIPFEEFYSFKTNPRGSVRVLASIDESSYLQGPNTSCDPTGPTFPQGYDGKMGDHPISWCHDKFAGRAWYTALGHEAYLYLLPEFQQHLLNGIFTATRRVEASCAVNGKPAEVPAYIEPVLVGCETTLLP